MFFNRYREHRALKREATAENLREKQIQADIRSERYREKLQETVNELWKNPRMRSFVDEHVKMYNDNQVKSGHPERVLKAPEENNQGEIHE